MLTIEDLAGEEMPSVPQAYRPDRVLWYEFSLLLTVEGRTGKVRPPISQQTARLVLLRLRDRLVLRSSKGEPSVESLCWLHLTSLTEAAFVSIVP